MKLKNYWKKYMSKKNGTKKWYHCKNRNQPVETKLKYFKNDLSEFDSPDQLGSGLKNMNINFVKRLDQARDLTMGVPFKINSGYRTQEYNDDLKARGFHTSPTSSHMKGLAADISTPDARSRYKILKALMDLGFSRFGIGELFIHVDASPENEKSQDVCWDYY